MRVANCVFLHLFQFWSKLSIGKLRALGPEVHPRRKPHADERTRIAVTRTSATASARMFPDATPEPQNIRSTPRIKVMATGAQGAQHLLIRSIAGMLGYMGGGRGTSSSAR